MMKFTGPDLRSSAVKRFLKKMVARAMAMGGTMPPAITAAITGEKPPAAMAMEAVPNT